MTFTDNSAHLGGAIYYADASGPESLAVSNSVFLSNSASSDGGALATEGPTDIAQTVFEGNFASSNGGALATYADLTVTDSEFVNNSGPFGGGALWAALQFSETATFTRANFISNSGSPGGAARLVTDGAFAGAVLHFDSCAFVSNSSGGTGGAIDASRTVVHDSTFFNNTSAISGGAIRSSSSNYPRISSSTFYMNTAMDGVGGINLEPVNAMSPPIIRNVVMAGNGTDILGGAGADVTYSCTESFVSLGEGNVFGIPDPIELGPNDELFLDQGSLCVDAGDSAAATTDYAALGLDWEMLTTDALGTFDEPPVDMGVHYAP